MSSSPVVIVTGASRGLGAAMARQFDSLGCRCLLVARSAEELRQLKAELNSAEVLVSDLGQPGQGQAVIEKTVELFGELHALVNNAGTISPIAPLAKADPDTWARAITVNLTGPAQLMAAALPHLVKTHGRVVNISSGAAVKVVEGWSAYCTSKAGLLHLSKAVAQENPEVGCFSLRPGVIDTQMQSEIRASDGMAEADLKKFQALKAEQNLEPPEVPAKAAVWLALRGPIGRSGDFIQYTDPDVSAGVEELFSTLEGSHPSKANAASAS